MKRPEIKFILSGCMTDKNHALDELSNMSKRIGKLIIIEPERSHICQLCGEIEELRPYGPGGISICYTCAEKHRETVDHNMHIVLFGEPGELR